MPTPILQTLENSNAKRSSVSISGPAFMVAVGGAPRGSKSKTRKYAVTIPSRYLGPSTGSCHDLCKYGLKDESLDLNKPATRFGSRKTPVLKNKDVKKFASVIPGDPVKVIKLQDSLPLKKIGALKQSLLTSRKSTQNGRVNEKELKKIKIRSVERPIPKVNHTGSLPRNRKLVSNLKDQNKIKHKSKTASKTVELEFEPLTVEVIESPPNVTTESKSTNVLDSESSQLSSEKQVLDEKNKVTNNEEVVFSQDYEMETSEGNGNYKVVICEDEEDEGLEVKFRRGTVVEGECEDDGPTKMAFRRGKVVEGESEDESEIVSLKHEEMQEKEAQELLNRVIEETASKLVVEKKTKVRALVGAFESVISAR